MQSSRPPQDWGSIGLSLSQVETSASAGEALRRNSLVLPVLPLLPLLPVLEQRREEQFQLGLRVHHTETRHCSEVGVEAYYSQAKEQASE